MKKPHLGIAATLAATLLLGACAHKPDRFTVQSQSPAIRIDGAAARIDPPVLFFDTKSTGGKAITITWRLDPASGFRFAERGIEVEGEITDQIIRGQPPSVVLNTRQDVVGNCKVGDERRLSYTCVNTLSRAGVFKYTIRVTDGKREITHDPVIANW